MMAEWKAAGRAGSEDQALWQQFRGARDRVFALRRELAAARQRRREEIKVAKEGLITEARAVGNLPPEELQAELDRLMAAWKRAGSAGRDADDELWQQFREARGVGFSKLRQAAARAERSAANAAATAEQTVVAAQRMAFSDSAVSRDEVERLERNFDRAADTVEPEVKEQFQEALGRLRTAPPRSRRPCPAATRCRRRASSSSRTSASSSSASSSSAPRAAASWAGPRSGSPRSARSSSAWPPSWAPEHSLILQGVMDPELVALRDRYRAFMEAHVYPNEMALTPRTPPPTRSWPSCASGPGPRGCGRRTSAPRRAARAADSSPTRT